jgi:hypothetical protein
MKCLCYIIIKKQVLCWDVLVFQKSAFHIHFLSFFIFDMFIELLVLLSLHDVWQFEIENYILVQQWNLKWEWTRHAYFCEAEEPKYQTWFKIHIMRPPPLLVFTIIILSAGVNDEREGMPEFYLLLSCWSSHSLSYL